MDQAPWKLSQTSSSTVGRRNSGDQRSYCRMMAKCPRERAVGRVPYGRYQTSPHQPCPTRLTTGLVLYLPCVLWKFWEQPESPRRTVKRDSFQSAESMGNICLWLWISAHPETDSNTQKQEQSLLKLSQECRDSLWVLSMDSSVP